MRPPVVAFYGPPMNGAAERNHAIYEDLWSLYDLFPHDGWSAWNEIAPSYRPGKTLEIGPGKFPHVPIDGTYFVDLSRVALDALSERGGLCARATTPLPFPDGTFELVCLFEVLEHLEDDAGFLKEIQRVMRPGGALFFSCPMNPAYWTYYDKVMGHERRYRGEELTTRLEAAGFEVERICARHDRMDRWFGAVFGFGTKYLGRFTSRIVSRYLPKVAALPWEWRDTTDFTEAEQRGGVTVRARKR